MAVEAKGFQAIRINPSNDWLDYGIVNKYKDSKYSIDKGLKFVGEQGTMPLLPKTLYLVINPSLVMEMSKEGGEFFQSITKSSFSFGPFQSRKGSTLEVKKQKNGDYRVEFKTNNDVPQ